MYDPVASTQLRTAAPAIHVARSALAAIKGSDVVVVATEWPEFATLELGAMRRAMRGNLLVDGRSLFDVASAHRAGLDYFSFSTAGLRPCPVEELAAVAS